MSIAARLERVEKAAGVGRRCLSCRAHYIRLSDEIRRTAPAELFVTACCTCKQTLKEIHSGYTERERSILAAVSSDYSDASKWLASSAWVYHLPRFQEIEKIGEAEEKRLRELVRSDNSALRQSARKRVKVLDEYAGHKTKLVEAAEKRKQRAAAEEEADKIYAPVLATLGEVMARQAEIRDEELFRYSVMAEMEVFMWGVKSAETLKLIEERQRQLAEEEAERKREAEERERKYQEERRLREEERKRQQEEYLARKRSVGSSYQSPMPNQGISSQPPPDDGTTAYQHKLARWRQTGVWPLHPWD